MYKSILLLLHRMRWVLVIFLMTTTVVLTLMPADEIRDNAFLHLPYGDKLAHFLAYFTLGFFWGNALNNSKNLIIKTVVILFFFGFLLEMGQFYFLVGRFFEIFDIIANIIGSIAGVLVFYAFWQKSHTTEKRPY